MRVLLATLFLLLQAVTSSAQPCVLRILPTDSDSAALIKISKWPDTKQADSMSLWRAVADFAQSLHQAGYLEASIDTLLRQDQQYTALLHLGPRYQWLQLSGGQVPESWLSKAGFRARLFQNKTLEFPAWLEFQKRLAGIAANNGSPFARVQLDSVAWAAPGQVSATITMQRGELIFFEKTLC